MDPQLQALRFWHDVIFVYALLMGIAAPALVFLATLMGRPRRELLLALVPAVAFAWGMWSAKLIADQYTNAVRAWQVGLAHYPALRVMVDADTAVDSAARTGWNVGIVVTLVLIGAWLLVLRWSAGKGLPSSPRLPRPRSEPSREQLPSPLDNANEDSIEIVVERMDFGAT
jgi:hypothetical protein